MYGYNWTGKGNLFQLAVDQNIQKEIRPVFKEELDFFEFNKVCKYPKTDAPLLWAEGIRKYIVNGETVAEGKGGGFYTKPKIVFKKKSLTFSQINIEKLWKQKFLDSASFTAFRHCAGRLYR